MNLVYLSGRRSAAYAIIPKLMSNSKERFARLVSRAKTFLFHNTTTRQTVAKNTVWLGIAIVVSRLIRAVLIIYVARLLGTEGYGVFSYAVSLAAFFAIFSDIGIVGILTREVAKDPASLQKHFVTGFVVKMALVLVSIILIVGVAPFFTKIPAATPLLWLAALLIAFDGLRDLALAIPRAQEKMQVEAGFTILANVAITGIGLAAIFVEPTPGALFFGYVAGSGIGMAAALWHLRQYFKGFFAHFDRTLIPRLFKEAWPFALTGLLGVIMTNTDSVMLGWYMDASAVGLYGAALRVIQVFYFMPVVLGSSTFPVFSSFSESDPARFRAAFETVVTAAFVISMPLALGGILLSRGIIELVFGNAYLGAVLPFQILVLTAITNFPSSFLINGIFAYRRQHLFAFALGIGAIGNVILNVLLIPRFGIAGSAFATLLAQFLSYGAMWYWMQKINPFRVFRKLLRPAAATLGMAVLVFGLRSLGLNVIIICLSGAALYFALLLLMKEPLLENVRIRNLVPKNEGQSGS